MSKCRQFTRSAVPNRPQQSQYFYTHSYFKTLTLITAWPQKTFEFCKRMKDCWPTALRNHKTKQNKTEYKEGHTQKEEPASQTDTQSPALPSSVGWTTATCTKASVRCEKLSLSSPWISPHVPGTHRNGCPVCGGCGGPYPERPWTVRWGRKCSLLVRRS